MRKFTSGKAAKAGVVLATAGACGVLAGVVLGQGISFNTADAGSATPPPTTTTTTTTTTTPVSTPVKAKVVAVKKKHRKAKVTFTTSGGTPPYRTTCKVDKRGARPCTSPFTANKLKPGKHHVVITVVDSTGQKKVIRQTVKIKK